MDGPEVDDRLAASEPRWGLGDAAGGYLIGLVVSGLVASIWLGATGDDELDLLGKAVSQMGLWVGLLGAPVAAARWKGSGSLAQDFRLRWAKRDLWLGPLIGVLCHVVVLPLVALVLWPLLGRPETEGPVLELLDEASGLRVLGLVCFTVIGAPFVEELFFRGLLMRSLERRWGTIVAVVVSSCLFGVTHLQDLDADALILVMVSLAVLGTVLAVITLRTQRLGTAILAHATFNAVTLIVLSA